MIIVSARLFGIERQRDVTDYTRSQHRGNPGPTRLYKHIVSDTGKCNQEWNHATSSTPSFSPEHDKISYVHLLRRSLIIVGSPVRRICHPLPYLSRVVLYHRESRLRPRSHFSQLLTGSPHTTGAMTFSDSRLPQELRGGAAQAVSRLVKLD